MKKKQHQSILHVVQTNLADMRKQVAKSVAELNKYPDLIQMSLNRLSEGRANPKDIDRLVAFLGGRKQALLAENRRNRDISRNAPPGCG